MLLTFILLEAMSKDAVGVMASLGKDAGKSEGKLSRSTARSPTSSLEWCRLATCTLKWVGAGWEYPKPHLGCVDVHGKVRSLKLANNGSLVEKPN